MAKTNDARRMAAVSQPSKENTLATPDAVVSPTSGNGAANPSGGPLPAGMAEAHAVIEGARRRGRPPGSTNTVKADKMADAQRKLEALSSTLFAADNFTALVELPGDVGFALTKNEHWLLSEKESKVLSSTASTAAQLVQADPRWVALSLFALSLISIYGSRVGKEMILRKQSKEKEAFERSLSRRDEKAP